MELVMRDTLLLSMERREARRTDSWLMLCRRPAIECRSFSEQRTVLRCEGSAAATETLSAACLGVASGWRAFSADRRSDGEMLTTTPGEGISGGDWAELGVDSTSMSASCCTSIPLFSFSSGSWGVWISFLTSCTSAFVCLLARVARLGRAVEVDASGSSSAIKFRAVTAELRRLLRLPLDNLDAQAHKIRTTTPQKMAQVWKNKSQTYLRLAWTSSWRPKDTLFLRLLFFCDGVFGINSGSALKSLQ